MIILNSNRLQIHIAEPGESPNNTCRFDRTGYITEVILDGQLYFCSSEPRNLWHPCSGGRGFCNEYLVDYSNEVSPEEYFPKLGIGLFPRKEQSHSFHMKYDHIKEFPVTYEAKQNQVTFRMASVPCLGIAVETQKHISCSDNMISMEMTAINTGDRPISTLEYCHNFISIAGMALSADYRIELPNLPDFGTSMQLDVDNKPCNWRGNGHGYSIRQTSTDIAYIHVDLSDLSMEDAFAWKISHAGARAYVEGKDYFRPAKLDIWAADHIISPEVFYSLELSPGETRKWKRTLTFEQE